MAKTKTVTKSKGKRSTYFERGVDRDRLEALIAHIEKKGGVRPSKERTIQIAIEEACVARGITIEEKPGVAKAGS